MIGREGRKLILEFIMRLIIFILICDWFLTPLILQMFFPFNLLFVFYDVVFFVWVIGEWFIPRSGKYRNLYYSIQSGRNKWLYILIGLSLVINLMYWSSTIKILSRGYV